MSSVVVLRWSFYAFLVALPLGTRKLLFQFTPGFHEYETVFIYATDLFLAVFVTTVLIHAFKNSSGGKFQIPNSKFQINSKFKTHALFAFLLFAGVSVFFAPSFGLALYSYARLLTVVAFAAAVAYVLRKGVVRTWHVFGILAASAVFQSFIAFAQFVKQGSVGLRLLGEPVLSATAPGIAKFTAEGGKILRAYGTFPHPNVLGAFLVIGLLALSYLWLRNTNDVRIYENKQHRFFRNFVNFSYFVACTAGIFVITVGILLTFSRSAWLVAIIVSIALLLYGFAHSDLRRRAAVLLFALVASGYTLVAILSPLIFPRAQISATEPSVVQRLEYNRLGMDLITQHPFGVGIGNQVLYSVRNGLYEKFGMTKAWQWEPIHNIYILIAAEIGILGLATFLLLLLFTISNIKFLISNLGIGHFIRNWKLVIRNSQNDAMPLDAIIPRIMLLSFMAFGLVDHFLWTLRPGQLMLWLAIGLVWGTAGRENRLEVE